MLQILNFAIGLSFVHLLFGVIVLTALAVSLDAQFWFDTLNQFINIRGNVPPDPPKDGNKTKPQRPGAAATGSCK